MGGGRLQQRHHTLRAPAPSLTAGETEARAPASRAAVLPGSLPRPVLWGWEGATCACQTRHMDGLVCPVSETRSVGDSGDTSFRPRLGRAWLIHSLGHPREPGFLRSPVQLLPLTVSKTVPTHGGWGQCLCLNSHDSADRPPWLVLGTSHGCLEGDLEGCGVPGRAVERVVQRSRVQGATGAAGHNAQRRVRRKDL